MKARVAQTVLGDSFGSWRLARTSKGARRTETGIVDQHDEYVWCALGRPQGLDRRKL